MKKQLLALSAMFVVFAAQGSYFERAKAYAKEKYAAAKQTLQANLPAIQGMVKENLPAVQEFAKTNILPTAQKIAEDNVILGDKLDSLAKSVPGGESALSKMKDLYMSQVHPTFEKKIVDGEVQWEDKSKATFVKD